MNKKLLVGGILGAVMVSGMAVAADGEKVFNGSCAACHATGAAGAPKVGDKGAWASLIAKGADALYNSAIKGVPGTSMMARGTCMACSDDDLKAAVDYMVTKSK